MNDDHIPAPAEHSPRKRAVQQADTDLTVWEDGAFDDTHLFSDYSVPVTQ